MKTNTKTTIAVILLLSGITLVALLSSCTGPKVVSGERFIQVVYEPFTLHVPTADTICFYKSDGIAGIFLLPNGTDTVKIKGGIRTFKGYSTDVFIPIPMSGLGFGYNDMMRMDSVCVSGVFDAVGSTVK